ncbi:MAG: 2-oxoacid:acceptor oxidoreductase family protein [Dehalococcoidia bacterium]|nr:2-oxoacid:acceptor oxidoreductase family protein [Dehalococcoidia bacterium]
MGPEDFEIPAGHITDTRPYEIRWHGRGGQGAITAAKILAQAAHLDGYPGATAAPSFGAERRGAPVSGSTRLSSKPILLVSQIDEPDMVVVLDHTLLKDPEVLSGLRPGGWLVVNCRQAPRQLNVEPGFNVATVDATRICRELGLIVGGLIIVNTAMLGAVIRASGLLDLAALTKPIKERFSNRAADLNLAAIERTYKETTIEKAG